MSDHKLNEVLRQLDEIKRELAEIRKGTVHVPVPQPYPVPCVPWAPYPYQPVYPPHPGWRLVPNTYPHPVPYWQSGCVAEPSPTVTTTYTTGVLSA